MANTITLKRRIQSVKNTRQITKAMELVAASKMRRAQEHALRSRNFRNLARQILTRLSELTDVTQHPLYKQRTVRNRLHILITSDRGLAGAYNSNLFRQFTTELMEDRKQGVKSSVILVGKKGHSLIARLKNIEVMAVYNNFPDQPTANEIQPILQMITKAFTSKAVDSVDVTYTDYVSSINQVVRTEKILPAVLQPVKIDHELGEAIFEPSPQVVLNSITERLIEVQLNQAFNESQASEHSMRMMAMKSASDNATGLVDDLTLEYNTARQAAITQELAEITGGAEAMK